MEQKRVLIAGLGLIGGSLARAVSENEDTYLIGYDINQSSLEFALKNGLIQEAFEDFSKAAMTAEVIILAAPISETIKLMRQLDRLPLNEQILVTDTASVKGSIVKTAQAFSNEKIAFIGGHPMAGSHKHGVEASKAHLFENAIYVLTPSVRSTPEMLETLQEILTATKSKFITLQPEEHDEMTGVVSHFPHLIASSLVHQAKKWELTHDYLPKLAAGGFRDITRIASSNPEMWQDIFYHNSRKMSVLLQEWINEMKQLKELLDHNEKENIISFLQTAKQYRDGIPEKSKGAIPAFHDLYIDIRDQTGAIASVATILAEKEISIKNIEILEVREGITGALRLSFYSQKAQQKGRESLEENGYDTTIQQ